MIDFAFSFACNAHQSSASPGTVFVLEENGESSNASCSAGARKAYDIEPRYVGIGHETVA
jgi:hypothetical protein